MNGPSVNILRSGADALLAQGSLHLQLIQVEWALEKLRYRRMMNLVLMGVPMITCSLLAFGYLVMAISWDTRFRIVTAVVLFMLYSTGAVITVYRLQRLTALGKEAFADSRREIAADIALLRGAVAR
jgi:uncharacterized membrane protein YqjE